ncbi:MAG TPA: serine/threonine-protein kinase, partial [Burkholderiaceae bacterium]|nr:serine/threonine-protein kinase [Burkholderiaceae bacterium]
MAADTRLGRQVALKTVLPALSAKLGRDGVAALLQEARIVSTLSHPNIVPLYDAFEDAGVSYLVFEYVEGQSLADLIRQSGKLETGRAVVIAIALAQAVAYAHERNIVHRDIKPGNVMITRDGVPRLMDFGIASSAAAAGADSRTLLGTPSYMAPEYIEEGIYLPSSDVFALGVVLYEMLTGTRPFRAPTPLAAAIRRAQRRQPVSSVRPEAPKHWTEVIEKCLEYDAASRYPSAAAVADALRQPPSRIARARSAMGRASDVQRAVWLVLAVLLLGGLGAWLWYGLRGYYQPTR